MQNYIIVKSYSYTELMLFVNSKIDEGYIPTGGVVISDLNYFYQAMIRKNLEIRNV